MTREERIKSALLPILEKMREHGATDEMCKMYDNGFHVGAMWADRSMVDKACEWLRVELDKEEELHYIHVHGFDKERREIFLEDFRKAMKGD